MEPTVIVLIVVIVLLVIGLAAAGVLLSRRKRSERLQDHYGPEYARSLDETGGDRRSAEAQLAAREERHSEFDIRDLRPEERERFSTSWTQIQRGFVDDPVQSVHAADDLVGDIMRTRGYPVDDFDRRAEDLSVEHPDVVQHYREARKVRDATDHGEVDTDQQRHAVTSYRSLVEALIGSENDHTSSSTATSTEEQTR